MPQNRGLSRILAIWLAGFALISSLALAAWMGAWNQRQSLIAFRDLAAANAAFVVEMRFPKSPQLARRLATVLDMGVGFHFEGKPAADWPKGLAQPIEQLAGLGKAASRRVAGFEVAVSPLDEPGVFLVLLREARAFSPGFTLGMLIPVLGLAIAGGGLAFGLGLGMVRPLSALRDWLPNLDVEPEKEPAPISASILKRPDEIGALARALRQTSGRIREEQRLRRQSERLATLGRIATSLAHEIKNPAAAIGLHADVLRQEVSPAQQEPVGLIREEVDRIIDLVNQWLFVARARPGKTQRHDLSGLLRNVSQRLEPVFGHAGVAFELAEGEAAWVEVDAPRVEQALRNLLLNSVQAMSLGGAIRASIETGDVGVELQIDDGGSGFSEMALAHFGEPFFSEREGGMGIGLTLATEVIQSHGGSIVAANRPESGARVICRLPRADLNSEPQNGKKS